MTKYDYPELLRKGTVVGPVTKEMRERCKVKIRRANQMAGDPDDDGMEYWPDFLSVVREEMKNEQS